MMDNASEAHFRTLFKALESNKQKDVDEARSTLNDQFLSVKENWLVNGLFDYILNTNSQQVMDILVNVREPHDKFLLDRLSDVFIKCDNHDHRFRSLIFLGRAAKRQPVWLHKLTNHSLFRELLKLLKLEKNTLLLVSALLLLAMLLPMLPTTLGPCLNEIFEVFNRLANLHTEQSILLGSTSSNLSSFPMSNVPLENNRFLHLNIALNNLFHRLYAMYPCNFISYLKQQYSNKNNMPTFLHTIKPMLDSVRMNPLLITMTKDAEITSDRWKRIEHHDIVAECGRFAIDKNRKEETVSHYPPFRHFTPIPDIFFQNTLENTEEYENFWSPSMMISSNSPPNIGYDSRSTPTTPNNSRSRSTIPEPAIEATPQTTPVKDLRTSQRPMSSSAVRTIGNFGNGILCVNVNSRPTTPVPTNSSGGDCTPVKQKIIGKLLADRQNITLRQVQAKIANEANEENYMEMDGVTQLNEKNSSCAEDQEISAIVNSRNLLKKRQEREKTHLEHLTERTKLCSSETYESQFKKSTGIQKNPSFEESSLMSNPYEDLLNGVLEQNNRKFESENSIKPSWNLNDGRTSPSDFQDRYINCCVRANGASDDPHKSRYELRHTKHKKGTEEGEGNEDNQDDEENEAGCCNQQLQLMMMQLQFERQHREVHDERNRRLLGKLRTFRSLEEYNSAMLDRLKNSERDMEMLKSELNEIKRESQVSEERILEALHDWQHKCAEEESSNRKLKDRVKFLEIELASEKQKLTECLRDRHKTAAALVCVEHKLKNAMKAASHNEMLRKDAYVKRLKFLLVQEAQMKMNEHSISRMSLAKDEASLIQKSYAEELSSKNRLLESQNSQIEALRSHLMELETRCHGYEMKMLENDNLLQQENKRHACEVEALESKYKCQAQINLFMQARVLELHAMLETCKLTSRRAGGSSSAAINLASPRERSPPLSSLSSSSEGSLYVQAGSTPGGAVMNEICNPGGEIPNLQAIVELPKQSETDES